MSRNIITIMAFLLCASCVASSQEIKQDNATPAVEIPASVDTLIATEDDMRIILSGQACKKPFSKYVFIRGDSVSLIDMKSPDSGRTVSLKASSGVLDVFYTINNISKSATAPYCGGKVSVGGVQFTLMPGVYYPVPLLPDLPKGVSAIEITSDGAANFTFTNDISDAVKIVTYMDLRDKYSKLNILGRFKTIPELKKEIDELKASVRVRRWQNVYIFRVRAAAGEFVLVEVLS